jgi:S1-C subfamily serine protease
LKDAKNDVALIQIVDTSFKGFSYIPYSLAEATETGEKVFTIGYPLNDIMGVNYKVNDGIIGSSSGIAGDIRYFQISVPLQPGNSGGPLFNKNGNVIGITTARLNSDAMGTTVENVNYAIKISYLVNLYNMLPDAQNIQKESKLAGKELQEQVKSLKNYICIIRVY